MIAPTRARLHIAPVYPQILHFEVGQQERSLPVVLNLSHVLQPIVIRLEDKNNHRTVEHTNKKALAFNRELITIIAPRT